MKADLDAKKATLQDAAMRFVASGTGKYTADVQKQNEEKRQEMQSSTPTQVQKQQTAPELTPKQPSMGGHSK